MRENNFATFLTHFKLYQEANDEIIKNLQKRIDFLENKLGYKYEPDNPIKKINQIELSMMGDNNEK